jgi:hypothetical protein
MHSALRSLLLPLMAGMALATAAAEPVIAIVSSDRSGPYQEAAEGIARELSRPGEPRREAMQLSLVELAGYRGPTPRLYIALGTDACAVLARGGAATSVLCTLLPRVSFERVLRETGRRAGATFTALYLNQPPGRQLDLMRLALPQARRVGVLWGPESQATEAPLEAAAQARGLKIVGVAVKPNEQVFNGLKKLLDESDLLLAVADPQIYNSTSIQNILLASFRAEVPMMAFSPAYVRAGALLAVYSTPTQIGQQAGALARGVLLGQPLGVPQYPLQFEISVNEHVARSLGLKLDADQLAERLRRLERGS